MPSPVLMRNASLRCPSLEERLDGLVGDRLDDCLVDCLAVRTFQMLIGALQRTRRRSTRADIDKTHTSAGFKVCLCKFE